MYLEPFYTKKERKRISCLMWGILTFFLLTSLGYTMLSCVCAEVSWQLISDNHFMTVIGYMAQYTLAFPVCLLIMRKVPADPMEQHEISRDEWFMYFCIAYFCMFSGAMISNGLIDVIREMTGQAPVNPLADTTVYSVPELLLDLLASVILAPVAEELVFRKFLLDRVNRLGDIPAILMSGLIFGFIHGNFYQFFYAVLAGLLFAWVYLRTGKIRYTILLHMAINLTTGILPEIVNSIPAGELQDICYMGYDVITFVLGGAGLLVLLWMIMKKRIHFLRGWLNTDGRQVAGVMLLNSGMICCILAIGFEYIGYL